MLLKASKNGSSMNVKELREYLTKFPDDMEVVIKRKSDYETLNPELHLTKEKAVQFHQTPWITRFHETMDDAKKAMARDYLLIDGN